MKMHGLRGWGLGTFSDWIRMMGLCRGLGAKRCLRGARGMQDQGVNHAFSLWFLGARIDPGRIRCALLQLREARS